MEIYFFRAHFGYAIETAYYNILCHHHKLFFSTYTNHCLCVNECKQVIPRKLVITCRQVNNIEGSKKPNDAMYEM